jgi:hypothetical protein
VVVKVDKETKDGIPSQDTFAFSEAQQKWNSVLSSSKYSSCNVLSAIQGAYMNNPYIQNDRLKRVSSYPQLYSRDQLEEALKNPRNSESTLRNASWFFSYTIPTIMKLYYSYSEIPLNKWYILPEGVDKKKFNKPEFKNEFKLVYDIVKKINPEKTFRNIMLTGLREGKVAVETRCEIKDGKVLYSCLHELPSDYWKITSRTSSGWGVSFDMTYFLKAGNHPSQFHPVFQEYWDEMMCYRNKDGSMKTWDNLPNDVEIEKISHVFGSTYVWWKELPVNEIFHVISFDDSDVSVLPPFMSSFLDVSDINSYKYLQQEILQLPLSSILTAQVPLNDTNNKSGSYGNDTKISPDLILLFQDIFNSISGSNYTKSFFAPFEDFKMHKIDAPTKDNIVGDALSNFYSQMGISSLFTTEKKPSVMQSKIFQKLETAFMTKFYEQFVEMINDIINNLGLKFKYNFKLFGDIFSKDDRIAGLEKGLAQGHKSLIFEYLAYNNQTIFDAEAANSLLESWNYYDHLQPTVSAFQATQDEKKNGRPNMKEDKVSNDSTAAGLESGSSKAEGREQSE